MLVLLGGRADAARRRRADADVAARLYASFTALAAGAAGVLAMFQWDDITDEGPATLVGGALAFDTLAEFLTITICVAVFLVSLVTTTTCGARPRRPGGVRAVPRGRDRRRRDGVGQRPDRAVPRSRDAVARAVRARRLGPAPQSRARRAASSTSCSAASRRRSSCTASPSIYGGTGRPTSARSSPVPGHGRHRSARTPSCSPAWRC